MCIKKLCSIANRKIPRFGKQYLRLLVKDVRITGKEIRLRGSYKALAHTMVSGNVDTPEGVPTLGYTWRALRDSNPRPLDPKSSALSS
jgi:hypothetical protein